MKKQQRNEAEATAAQKYDQGFFPKTGSNRFRAAFLLLFSAKK
ncbi:MAG TPA: hypothetical protein PLL71_04940 [Agriterribacter sp.]|nr:hypothetical protein [Agriterribacter sp.]